MSNIFIPRTTAPSRADKNYIKTTKGGFNYCMLIKSDTGSVMPNCVGYAWGRWRELLGKFHELSRGNAEVWWNKNDGYQRSQTPRLGSVACWSQGSTGTGNDGAGHVAIVEAIDADGTITISNSAYKGTRFYMRKIKAPYNYAAGFKFQGFIHLPGSWVNKPVTPPSTGKKPNDVVAAEVKRGEWGNGEERKKRLEAAGYDYNAIQAIVNGSSAPTKKTNQQIADEVRLGRWGNGQDRVNRLTAAGYDAKAIQDIVNGQNGSGKLTNDQVADKVLRGDYGNGQARKDKLRAEGYDPDVIQSIVNRKSK